MILNIDLENNLKLKLLNNLCMNQLLSSKEMGFGFFSISFHFNNFSLGVL